MDGARFVRLRWRLRGAWLWPTFVVVTVLDGVIIHARPPAGTAQNLAGGIVIAMTINVIAVLLFSQLLGRLIRRRRTDLPIEVARNYGGTAAISLITAIVLGAGLAHHTALVAEQHTLREVIVRAEAFIGDHAPAPFRAMASHTDTYTIQPGQIYRTCVPDRTVTRTYCVIVKPRLPLTASVVFGGYEPNAVLAQGTN
ncbi:MAG: hypothetical protein ABI355_07635 [Solirubrobacteraceae bacterium]